MVTDMTKKELLLALDKYSEEADVLMINSRVRETPKNIIQVVEIQTANAETVTPVIVV